MRGRHHIVIETHHLKYEFEICRNITLIQGDSATGKTTLIDILQAYARNGKRSGARLESDVPCVVYNSGEESWQLVLGSIHQSIVFFDEECHFVSSREFASFIQMTDNYYVFITREDLKNLPYSIHEIYGIRTSGKFHFPEQIYHEFYPIYPFDEEIIGERSTLLLVEDSGSGFQFFQHAAGEGIKCIAAGGNGKIKQKLLELSNEGPVAVIADGAAFGSYIRNVVTLCESIGHVSLYLPESFEWLILQSGTVPSTELSRILEEPEKYIDSQKFFSWERYFTQLLRELVAERLQVSYGKDALPSYFLRDDVAKKIIETMPKQLQKILFHENHQ